MIHLNTVQLYMYISITNTISLSAGDKNKGLKARMFITVQQLAKISAGGKNNGLKARMFTILKAQKLA